MNLPADYARCDGVKDGDAWREGCEDCLRRTDRSSFPLTWWMRPHDAVPCPKRIAPEEWK